MWGFLPWNSNQASMCTKKHKLATFGKSNKRTDQNVKDWPEVSNIRYSYNMLEFGVCRLNRLLKLLISTLLLHRIAYCDIRLHL